MTVVRSPVRSVVRSPVRGVFGGSASLIDDATSYLAGIAPYHWFDFVNDRCLYASNDVGGVSGATGYSFSRASTGYYTNADGTLTSFASGALRRGNRGVLIEGARTNLLLRSQEFDNASWSQIFLSTVTQNTTLAPDGTMTGYTLAGAGSGASGLVCNGSITSGTTYTLSIFAKKNATNFVQIVGASAAFGANVWGNFDLNAGTVGSLGASVTGSSITALANGWYRCSITGAATATTGSSAYAFALVESATATRLQSAVGATSIHPWGSQIEAASFPSSYIPTTTASATRAADVLTCTAGVSYPLSLWAEFERAVDTGGNEFLFQIDDGASNRAALRINTSDQLSSITVSTTQQSGEAVTGALSVGAVYKGALRVATDDVKAARDGSLSTGDSSAILPGTAATIRFGKDSATGVETFGYIRRAAIFNSALSDANLQSVTG